MVLGSGYYPLYDPWNVPFSQQYQPDRFKLAGKAICDVPDLSNVWRGVLEGAQADQDFLRVMFDLERTANRHHVCHYCDRIGYVSNKMPHVASNDPNMLYTVFGSQERVETLGVIFGLSVFLVWIVNLIFQLFMF